uniref:Uncharacterized protein n=1 Tax=Arion vulgaris TaxID=1028688 RepID=A0A0B6ZED6_9EUPU
MNSVSFDNIFVFICTVFFRFVYEFEHLCTSLPSSSGGMYANAKISCTSYFVNLFVGDESLQHKIFVVFLFYPV